MRVIGFVLLTFLGSVLIAQNPAINFDGTDDYIQTSYTGISGSSARTIEAWVRTSANCDPTTGGRQQIITDWGTASTGGRFTMNIMRNQALRLEVSGSGLNGQTAINDGYWHHVAAVYDPNATDELSLYVDGVLDTAGTIPTSISTGNTTDFRIGMRIDNANPFDGDIDEVRVFDYARTDSAIKADMFRELCNYPSGLVAYFRLNEGNPGANNSSKKTATEYISSKHGTLTNFNLYGSSSNWISGSSSIIGTTGDTIDVLECYEYTSSAGKNYTSPGTFYETFTNSNGCDSILTINLKLGRSYAITYPVACDSFLLPSGQSVFKSGTYVDTLYNANSVGCDSIRLSIVKINYGTVSEETVSDCDSAEVNGSWYFSSSDIDITSQLSNGCDSIHTIHLNINSSSSSSSFVEQCDSFISVTGNVYTSSGDYSDVLKQANSVGCDSVVYTDLTIYNSTHETVEVESCDSFTSPTGIVYDSSGMFVESFVNHTGCDSIITYDLVINRTQSINNELHECDSVLVNNNWYYNSQLVENTLTSAAGCDSMIKTDVSITSIDASIAQNGEQLEVAQKDASYQWYNCGSGKDVTGAVADTFTPKASGEYGVKVTLDGCSKNSVCSYVQPSGYSLISTGMVQIYPNPSSNGVIRIDIDMDVDQVQLFIYDLSGRIVREYTLEDQSNEIRHDLQSGRYILKVQFRGGVDVMQWEVLD